MSDTDSQILVQTNAQVKSNNKIVLISLVVFLFIWLLWGAFGLGAYLTIEETSPFLFEIMGPVYAFGAIVTGILVGFTTIDNKNFKRILIIVNILTFLGLALSAGVCMDYMDEVIEYVFPWIGLIGCLITINFIAILIKKIRLKKIA